MRFAFRTSLLFSLTATVAAANETPVPILKPGLWEILRTESLSLTHVTTERRCVGVRKLEMRAAYHQFEQEVRQCAISNAVLAAQKIEYVTKCERDPGVFVTSRVIYEGDFSKKFDRTSTVSINIPTPLEGAVARSAYKFIGACPKDTKPGESVFVNAEGRPFGKWNRYDPERSRSGTVNEKRKSRPDIEKK